MKKTQFWRFLLMVVLLSAIVQVVSAQVTPKMNVYAVWTPDEQLTTIDAIPLGTEEAGDDFRFVDLQIYAQGNVPFWAVNLSCTVGNTTQLDFISLSFPAEWGAAGTDYFHTPQADAELYIGAGNLSFTVTRLGSGNSQMGMNGQDYTQLIATARFKVNSLSANAQAAVVCSVMDFFDRNGAIAIKGKQTRLNNLMIYVGYTLTGVARRQGTTLNQNIEVTCGQWNFNTQSFVVQVGNPKTVFTSSTGSFRFGGTTPATALRDDPNFPRLFHCDFVSEFVQGSPNNQVLLGYVDFELTTAVKNLLPITLRTGDANGDGTVDFVNDVVNVAAANGATTTPFGLNDMNGDGKVTRIDIIFPAGNLGLTDAGNGLLSEHVLYGIGRDLATNFTYPNSRIWLSTSTSGDVANFNTRSVSRDFWPTLSPDGSTIAYVFQDRVSGRHKLAYLNASTGVITPTTFPATFTDHAFAPSWSPDGNRVAFVCAVDGGNSVNVGFLYNRGDICVVNVFDRTGLQINRLGVSSRIFPPTWMSYEDGYVLLYGGVDGDIHYYDFVTGAQGLVDIDGGAVSADVLDMPIAVDYTYNDNTTYLAYRFNDNDGSFDPHIRIGTISYDGSAFSGGVSDIIDADHVSLSVQTTGVDYFDVSPSLDFMFYAEYNFVVANYPGENPFTMVTYSHNDGAPLTWTGPVSHVPDSSVGNLTNIAGTSSTYNPSSPTNPTYLHVWRMSFDFVP